MGGATTMTRGTRCMGRKYLSSRGLGQSGNGRVAQKKLSGRTDAIRERVKCGINPACNPSPNTVQSRLVKRRNQADQEWRGQICCDCRRASHPKTRLYRRGIRHEGNWTGAGRVDPCAGGQVRPAALVCATCTKKTVRPVRSLKLLLRTDGKIHGSTVYSVF